MISETGFDIITPDELKMYRAKDLSWSVDLVIDCSGYAPAMEEALTFINPGGPLCIFGVSSPKAKMRCSIVI
jgi:threonine dehydrogenase-like Zn-dependent dehydrogenase